MFSIESALADGLGVGLFEALDVCDVLAVHDMVGDALGTPPEAGDSDSLGVTDGDCDCEPVSE